MVTLGISAETAGGSHFKLSVRMPGDKTEMAASDEFAAFGLLVFDFADHFAALVAVNRRLQFPAAL